MSTIKYLLDEHVNPILKRGLKSRQPMMIVWRVGEPNSPPRGTKDPEILLWCEQHTFLLITNNRSSMPIHLRDHLDAGRHCPGIFILNPNLSWGSQIDDLELIWQAADISEYRDIIVHLPLT
jgi:hypothetical protein